MEQHDPLDLRVQERAAEERTLKAKLESKTEADDFMWLLSSKRGRRIAWRLMGLAFEINGQGFTALDFPVAEQTIVTLRGERRGGLTAAVWRGYINGVLRQTLTASGTLAYSALFLRMIADGSSVPANPRSIRTHQLWARKMATITVYAAADISSFHSGGSPNASEPIWQSFNEADLGTQNVEIDNNGDYFEVQLDTVAGLITRIAASFADLRASGDVITVTLKDKNGSQLAQSIMPSADNDGSVVDIVIFSSLSAATALQPLRLRIATNGNSGQNNFGQFSALVDYQPSTSVAGSVIGSSVICGVTN